MQNKMILMLSILCAIQFHAHAKNLFIMPEALCKIYFGPLYISSYRVKGGKTSLCNCSYARQYHNSILCTHVKGEEIPAPEGFKFTPAPAAQQCPFGPGTC